jgi:hypothetical protein
MSTPPANPFPTMSRMIRHVSEQARNDIPADVARRVASMIPAFDQAVAGLQPAPLTIVIFHLKLPDEHRMIDYADVKGDQGAFDFTGVLQHNFMMARAFNPTCRIIYITGETDDTSFVPDYVTTVRLPLQPKWLMYERVVAVNAFMESKAFSSHTAFLDSDAFANWPLDRVFLLKFDVGVTFRDIDGLMPVNEGVIFAAHQPGLKARNFFRRYLATYEALCLDRPIIDFYKDIRRWRGGQLSLNAAIGTTGILSDLDQREIVGAKVRYLHCNDYNFTIKGGVEYQIAQLKRKYVLHLKGSGKTIVHAVAQFQHQLLRELLQA